MSTSETGPRGISSYAIQHPVGTLALASVVVVLGMLFAPRLAIDLLPDVEYPHIRVVVNYPGVTPEVVEEQVTRVLERELAATENLTEIHGRASEGRSYIEMYFGYGTNIDVALQDAGRHLDRARARLPDGIEPPRLMKMDPAQDPIYELAVRSSLRDAVEVRDFIDYQLAPQLMAIEGVGTLEAVGGLIREVEIIVDPERMRRYNLTMSDVANMLDDRNINLAAGNVTSEEFDILARTDGRFESVEAIAELPLRLNEGRATIMLSDIAEVRDGHQEQRLFARLHGEEAVQVSLMKQPEANTVAVIDAMAEEIERLQATGFIPADMELEPIRDASFFIRASLQSVTIAAVLGGLLAMLVIFLFLGDMRRALIVGVSLPLAILAALALMEAFNLTLNIMSLGGLALGVGLLLDNAIVMLENMDRHARERGEGILAAAHSGAREVVSAVVAATMTNLAAVLPFLLLTGIAALLFRDLILTVAFAVATSLVVAVTVVPALYALVAKPRSEQKSPFRRMWDRGMSSLTEAYRGIVQGAISYRYAVLGGAGVLLLGTFLVMQTLSTEFLPPVDDGRITMRFEMPAGTAPGPTNEVADEIEATVAGMPHVETVYTTAGGYFRGGQLSIRGGMIDMVVQLVPVTERRGYSAEQWVAEFGEEMRAVALPFVAERIRGPRIEGVRTSLVDADIAVGLTGNDLSQLEATAEEVRDLLSDVAGVGSVQIGRDERTQVLNVRVDPERASQYGVSTRQAGTALQQAVEGALPTEYIADGGIAYDVRVRFPRTVTGDAQSLGNIPIIRADGQTVFLGDIASFGVAEGPAHIERQNQVRIVRVNLTADLSEASIGDINQAVQERMQAFDLPDGVSLMYGGEVDALEESIRSLYLALALAAFLVFVVMAVQYERVGSSLIILGSLPFALVGAVALLWITGTPLSAPVLLGVVFLVGIVVNNAILLVEYADTYRYAHQRDAEVAVVEAGTVRLRPILMTTCTTLLGILPLAVGLGAGSELMQPLAIAVVGGLLLSTLLSLLFIPSLYVIARDIERVLGWAR